MTVIESSKFGSYKSTQGVKGKKMSDNTELVSACSVILASE